jgi:hypothetical protein
MWIRTNDYSIYQIIHTHSYYCWLTSYFLQEIHFPKFFIGRPLVSFSQILRVVIQLENCSYPFQLSKPEDQVIQTNNYASGFVWFWNVISEYVWKQMLRKIFGLKKDNVTDWSRIIKVKLPLCFNWGQRHESALGEWRCNPTHPWPRH